MSTNEVYRFCSRDEDDGLSTIALEAQEMARSASQPVSPGETIKGQLRRAARALGYPDGSWRLREAWYGRAGCWSARALEDLRSRYRAWDARQERLADAAAETLAALDRAGIKSETDRDAAVRKARVERIARQARLTAASRRRTGGG